MLCFRIYRFALTHPTENLCTPPPPSPRSPSPSSASLASPQTASAVAVQGASTTTHGLHGRHVRNSGLQNWGDPDSGSEPHRWEEAGREARKREKRSWKRLPPFMVER